MFSVNFAYFILGILLNIFKIRPGTVDINSVYPVVCRVARVVLGTVRSPVKGMITSLIITI